jgi:hypothetical protein
MKRRDAITAILAALPALLLALSAWINADAATRKAGQAKAANAETYQQAGESLGQLAERIQALEAKCGGGQ